MHELRVPADAGVVPPLPDGKGSLAGVTLCQQVGFCICGHYFQQRRRFRTVLSSLIRTFVIKGSAGQNLHYCALAVLRVRSECGRNVSHWFIGYGNLNDNDFTVKPLKPAAIQALFLGDAFEGDGEAGDLEIVGSKLDLELTYLADILRLDVTTESVVPFEFRPLAFI